MNTTAFAEDLIPLIMDNDISKLHWNRKLTSTTDTQLMYGLRCLLLTTTDISQFPSTWQSQMQLVWSGEASCDWFKL